MTPKGFEEQFAARLGFTVQEFRARGYVVISCNCDYEACQGWISVLKDQADDLIELFPGRYHYPSEEEEDRVFQVETEGGGQMIQLCSGCGCEMEDQGFFVPEPRTLPLSGVTLQPDLARYQKFYCEHDGIVHTLVWMNDPNNPAHYNPAVVVSDPTRDHA